MITPQTSPSVELSQQKRNTILFYVLGYTKGFEENCINEDEFGDKFVPLLIKYCNTYKISNNNSELEACVGFALDLCIPSHPDLDYEYDAEKQEFVYVH